MPMTPTRFGEFIADETEKRAKVIRAANLKADSSQEVRASSTAKTSMMARLSTHGLRPSEIRHHGRAGPNVELPLPRLSAGERLRLRGAAGVRAEIGEAHRRATVLRRDLGAGQPARAGLLSELRQSGDDQAGGEHQIEFSGEGRRILRREELAYHAPAHV